MLRVNTSTKSGFMRGFEPIFLLLKMERDQRNLIEPIGLEDSIRYSEKLTFKGNRPPDPYYEVAAGQRRTDLGALSQPTFSDIFC